ncbi:hypothetical protein RFI_07694 [Reticulomyxa filosa]|uniref:ATXR3 C-terminal domain-containing protein n=1 Tax=Reticulomyxa filosa TaxID=46433 RepID=X6NT29_RETFI|nr:hypothetical protein RFI_07694 [Reticulomyxa filosa]|eukprot:ETO29425.1 hypothetical protein RFI_07694 [Reticulomyxa filosa]
MRIHEMNPYLAENKVEESLKCLVEIRNELRKLKPTPFAYHHAAADCIDFYIHTKYWFTAFNYESFKSKVFSLRELGYTKGTLLHVLCAHNSHNIFFIFLDNLDGNAPPKKYNPQYVWGQLNFWERQTIEQPDASLSHSRRGTVALPNIECCYSKQIRDDLKRPYDYATRQELLGLLETKPFNPWTTRWHWNFRFVADIAFVFVCFFFSFLHCNPIHSLLCLLFTLYINRNGKIYGTPWLDAFIDEKEKEKLVTLLNSLKEASVHYAEEETFFSSTLPQTTSREE